MEETELEDGGYPGYSDYSRTVEADDKDLEPTKDKNNQREKLPKLDRTGIGEEKQEKDTTEEDEDKEYKQQEPEWRPEERWLEEQLLEERPLEEWQLEERLLEERGEAEYSEEEKSKHCCKEEKKEAARDNGIFEYAKTKEELLHKSLIELPEDPTAETDVFEEEPLHASAEEELLYEPAIIDAPVTTIKVKPMSLRA